MTRTMALASANYPKRRGSQFQTPAAANPIGRGSSRSGTGKDERTKFRRRLAAPKVDSNRSCRSRGKPPNWRRVHASGLRRSGCVSRPGLCRLGHSPNSTECRGLAESRRRGSSEACLHARQPRYSRSNVSLTRPEFWQPLVTNSENGRTHQQKSRQPDRKKDRRVCRGDDHSWIVGRLNDALFTSPYEPNPGKCGRSRHFALGVSDWISPFRDRDGCVALISGNVLDRNNTAVLDADHGIS